jgi:hypothetical protein
MDENTFTTAAKVGGFARDYVDTLGEVVTDFLDGVAPKIPGTDTRFMFGMGGAIRPTGNVTVRTYTGAAGREGITSSGTLRADTWVTLPGEVPSRAGHLQIEKLLEIQPGRGSNFLEFQVPNSNLRVPANGPRTSGDALQFQLNNPVSIDPSTFRLPPGRPGG